MGRLQVTIIVAIVSTVIVAATGFTAYNAAYPGAFATGRAEGIRPAMQRAITAARMPVIRKI